jgi:Domain of unknown function (DUF4412)
MNIILKAVLAIVGVCSFASPLQAAEGFLMVEKTVAGTATRTTQVQLERDRMRAELTGPAGETLIVVFDGPQQVLRTISVDRKSYTEMTKADADRIGAQVTMAMDAMKAKMAQMPPEQRAKMEAMMAKFGVMGPSAKAAATRPEYRRAGSDKVGKWTCDKYEGFRNGEKVSEVCTVEPKTLGLTTADFDISKQVAAFFQKLLPQGEEQIVGIATLETQGFEGIPVRRIRYTAGKADMTSEVTEVTRQTFAESSYDVPAGFEKQIPGKK